MSHHNGMTSGDRETVSLHKPKDCVIEMTMLESIGMKKRSISPSQHDNAECTQESLKGEISK